MSADNVIYIKQKKKYHVWEDCASIPYPTYKGKTSHKKFRTLEEADEYAKVLSEEIEPEYGIVHIKDTCCESGDCSCQE